MSCVKRLQHSNPVEALSSLLASIYCLVCIHSTLYCQCTGATYCVNACNLVIVVTGSAGCKSVWLGKTVTMKWMTSCGIWSVYTYGRDILRNTQLVRMKLNFDIRVRSSTDQQPTCTMPCIDGIPSSARPRGCQLLDRDKL